MKCVLLSSGDSSSVWRDLYIHRYTHSAQMKTDVAGRYDQFVSVVSLLIKISAGLPLSKINSFHLNRQLIIIFLIEKSLFSQHYRVSVNQCSHAEGQRVNL